MRQTTILLYGDAMKVIQTNLSEEYALREIINAYFPKSKIEYVSQKGDDDYVAVEYMSVSGKHGFACEAYIAGQVCKSQYEANEYSKNAVKKVVSDALKAATGIHLPWGLLTGIRPSKIIRELKDSEHGGDEMYLAREYEADESKSRLAFEVAKNEARYINAKYNDGISLYVGIPFCPSRCLYCSFTSQSIAFSNKLTVPFVEALKKEMREIAKTSYVKSKRIETVYFGGGTPSALTAEQIDDVLGTLFDAFDLRWAKEITFEAGRPDTMSKEKLDVLRKYGITRICINPQTANDATLKLIGRNHTVDDFVRAYKLARQCGFTHINCDIIAGLPGETEADFARTLSTLRERSPESITVHTMSIKHGSYLDMNYDMYALATANSVNNMLEMAYATLKGMGKVPYYMYRQKNMLGNLENTGYCDIGHECLYNIYIMEEVQSIIALGGGGSTKLVKGDVIERVFNVKEVAEYIKRIDEMIDRKKRLFEEFE
ncbi:MAG: coproporphyrinogen dehydrogenase HemZ [Clostridia bacterium]|nr:coproporphyrinogen dehydrogenase HemZ [Clostridia bacterium]